jgi:hypothetical protein
MALSSSLVALPRFIGSLVMRSSRVEIFYRHIKNVADGRYGFTGRGYCTLLPIFHLELPRVNGFAECVLAKSHLEPKLNKALRVKFNPLARLLHL